MQGFLYQLMVKRNMNLRLVQLFVFLFFFACPWTSNAGHLEVGQKAQYGTIKQAVAFASAGDTIIVQEGVYKEYDIIIDKPLTIIGQKDAIVDGQNKHEIFLIGADDVTIEGLHLRNAGVSFIHDNAAIKMDSVRNCIIRNNTFSNNFFAIYLARSADCLIENNQIEGEAVREATSGNGIHLWYCKNITIRNNRIKNHRDGIYFEFVEDSHIEGNLSEANLRYGLHFMFSHHCSYKGNIFKHNGAGVAVMYTKYVRMEENRFMDNWGPSSYGLLLKDITDSQVFKNEFTNNSIGMYIESSNRVICENNRFTGNGWAVKIMANSYENNFENNSFIRNAFDVATNSRYGSNTFNGNYWERYKGYDLDHNGIGDVPYHPVRLFSLIVEKQHPALILLRSFFIEILDMAEAIFPVLTPETLIDSRPKMRDHL